MNKLEDEGDEEYPSDEQPREWLDQPPVGGFQEAPQSGISRGDADAVQSSADHPYYQLSPEKVLDAVEHLGLVPDNRLFALNSYENRVYQVGLERDEGRTPSPNPNSHPNSHPGNLILKFYRPGRWSDEQILEEHEFLNELVALDIPAIAPLSFDGKTLLRFEDYRITVFSQCLGRTPELDRLDNLLILGRYLARIHSATAGRRFQHRNELSLQRFAVGSREFLLAQNFIPRDLVPAYESVSRDLIDLALPIWTHYQESPGPAPEVRLHGDCHPGNILWRDDVPYFVDFDDAVTGPAIQDIWMLLSGDRNQRLAQLAEIAEGYDEFADFPSSQLGLVETLRTMRLMNYSAWLARRWTDPAFPRSFPWFNTARYWSNHILELREQMAALQEQPLRLFP